MYGSIIIILVVMIICTIHGKLAMSLRYPPRYHPALIVIPMNSTSDIKRAGMARLAKPGMKACPQLLVPQTQETSLLQPEVL